MEKNFEENSDKKINETSDFKTSETADSGFDKLQVMETGEAADKDTVDTAYSTFSETPEMAAEETAEMNSSEMTMENSTFVPSTRTIKKQFSTVGWAIFVIFVASSLLQILVALIVEQVAPEIYDKSTTKILMTFLPLYLVAIPLGVLILRTMPSDVPAQNTLKPVRFLHFIPIVFCVMYAGNLIGMIFLKIIDIIFGRASENPVENLVSYDSPLIMYIFAGILAPIIEELVFRKLIIDKLHAYGEKNAILVSGLMFGLFHGNFSQFFYAFAIGTVFAYIYAKTGKIRYTIILHMIVNFLGAVVAPYMLKIVDADKLSSLSENQDIPAMMQMIASPQFLIFIIYALTIFALAIAGFVFILIEKNKVTFSPTKYELKEKKVSTICLNSGMILFFIGCLIMFVLSFINGN